MGSSIAVLPLLFSPLGAADRMCQPALRAVDVDDLTADDVGVKWRFALGQLVVAPAPIDPIILTGGMPIAGGGTTQGEMHYRQLPSWRPTTPDPENGPRPLTLLLDASIESAVTVTFDGSNIVSA
jgi:hypothetical protein